MSILFIQDFEGRNIPRANIRFADGHNDSDSAFFDVFTDLNGATGWPLPFLGGEKDMTLWVNDRNVIQDFKSNSRFIPKGDIHKGDDADGNFFIKLDRNQRQKASINGYYSNVFLKGESGFLDLCRKLHGEDIRPLLRQSLDMGSNGRRNFLMTFNTAQAAGLPPFNPDDFPNYYDVLEEMLEEYAEYGLYLYGSVFPDNGLFPSWAGQQKKTDHWNRVGTIAQRHNNFWGLELTNEINAKTFNWVDISKFSPIPGVISCSGSITDFGVPADLPNQWDLIDFHQTRTYTKSVTDACVANFPPREFHGKATGLGESVGFGDKALNGNREDNPRIAKEMAGSARGTVAMLIYHSTHGAFSQLYDFTEMNCGREWFGQLQGA